MRTFAFILYGICVGIGYAAAAQFLYPAHEPTTTVVVSAILILFCAWIGWGFSSEKGISLGSAIFAIGLGPLLPLFGVVIFGALMLCLLAVWPFFAISAILNERKFRRMMRKNGRFATIEQLQDKLEAGAGTVIQEAGPKGTYRVWWTDDDVLFLGKLVQTDDEFIEAFRNGADPFNARCLKEYLDTASGKAILTSIPAAHVSSQKFMKKFPRTKTGIVIRCLERPQSDSDARHTAT